MRLAIVFAMAFAATVAKPAVPQQEIERTIYLAFDDFPGQGFADVEDALNEPGIDVTFSLNRDGFEQIDKAFNVSKKKYFQNRTQTTVYLDGRRTFHLSCTFSMLS